MPGKLVASIVLLAAILSAATPALAQKRGGTLRLYHNDTPPSTSLLEESTIASVTPFAAIFNNLVVFDPAKPHESLDTVIGDLAESWSWDATNTKLTFKLHQGVKWHDGQPFTAKDVQCTWRMLIGKGDNADFQRNPRKVWYSKLQDVSINGEYEATFELSRAAAEPAGAARERLLAGLSLSRAAAGDAHQAGRHRSVQVRRVQARRHDPPGAQSRLLQEGPALSRRDRVPRSSTTAPRGYWLSRPANSTSPFPPTSRVALLKDVKERAPNAICEMTPSGTQVNLMVNRANPPFDNPDIRQAMSLALDRKPFNTILMEGQGAAGRRHAAAAGRRMGHAAEMVRS